MARGLPAGSTDVTITTGTTDSILITLSRPEELAPWFSVSAMLQDVTPQQVRVITRQ